jgi:TRAP-type mannitol/chloroaromatic compound transport system permease small subunit
VVEKEIHRLRFLLRFARGVDQLAEKLGALAALIVVLVVIVGFYNVATRYLGRYIGVQLASNSYIELQEHLFSAIFLLGFPYVLKHHVNVRVDFFYSRWTLQRRALVDLLGTLLVLLPLCFTGMFVTWNPLMRAWTNLETSGDPGAILQAPVRTLLFGSFILLALQSIAQVIKYYAAMQGDAEVIRSLVANGYGQAVHE